MFLLSSSCLEVLGLGVRVRLSLIWKVRKKIGKSDTEGAIKCFGKAEGLKDEDINNI